MGINTPHNSVAYEQDLLTGTGYNPRHVEEGKERDYLQEAKLQLSDINCKYSSILIIL